MLTELLSLSVKLHPIWNRGGTIINFTDTCRNTVEHKGKCKTQKQSWHDLACPRDAVSFHSLCARNSLATVSRATMFSENPRDGDFGAHHLQKQSCQVHLLLFSISHALKPYSCFRGLFFLCSPPYFPFLLEFTSLSSGLYRKKSTSQQNKPTPQNKKTLTKNKAKPSNKQTKTKPGKPKTKQ